ncbi:MAG: redoxin family protein [Bacteroidota bacterium]|jgi:hypothetical protein
MKKVLVGFSIVFWFFVQTVFSKDKIVFLGQIKNSIADTITLNDNWGGIYKTTVDPKGNFFFVFNAESEEFYNFNYRDILITTYLFPNDTLIMNFDYKDINSSIEYIGKKLEYTKPLYSISKGKPAPDFTLSDMNGQSVSLSNFKGKYVYIDVWSSYCGGVHEGNSLLRKT